MVTGLSSDHFVEGRTTLRTCLPQKFQAQRMVKVILALRRWCSFELWYQLLMKIIQRGEGNGGKGGESMKAEGVKDDRMK
jgi:hypothetical protein